MNGTTDSEGRGASAARQESLYGWDIHQVANSRHQQGPCGTCTTEDRARACIAAALSGVMGPGVYAWGLLSRIRTSPGDPAAPQSSTPVAWAAPGPDGTVAWLSHDGRSLIGGEETGMPRVSVNESVSALLSRFGGEMRGFRLAAGLSQGALAERIGCATAVVAGIESSRQMPSRVLVQRADRLLGTDGALVGQWPQLIRSAYPDWFWQIIELEQQAGFIQEFETVAIPGLLQTEAYARAIFTAAHPVASNLQIEQFVAARIDRQRILARSEPPQVMIILDEGVLRRRIGGGDVMSEQLGHLVETAGLPKVHLQVIPFSVGEHPGGMTPFRIMGFREGPDVLYGETFIGGQTTNDAGQLQQHKLAFNLIQSKALSRDDSRDLIRRLKVNLDTGTD